MPSSRGRETSLLLLRLREVRFILHSSGGICWRKLRLWEGGEREGGKRGRRGEKERERRKRRERKERERGREGGEGKGGRRVRRREEGKNETGGCDALLTITTHDWLCTIQSNIPPSPLHCVCVANMARCTVTVCSHYLNLPLKPNPLLHHYTLARVASWSNQSE